MKCPTCGRPILWTADFPERPFCSERCRLIDLGAWLNGDRAIPGEPVDDPTLLDPETDVDGDDAPRGGGSAGGRGEPDGRRR